MTIGNQNEDMETEPEKEAEVNHQYLEFCRNRLDELDAIVKDDFNYSDNLHHCLHPRVKFIFYSTKLNLDSNEDKTRHDTYIATTEEAKRNNVVNCDMLILASALKASGSNWLRKELEIRSQNASIEDDGVSILIENEGEDTIKDLEFLFSSFTEWSISDPSRLKDVLQTGIGKDLGLDKLVLDEEAFEDNDDEDKRKFSNKNKKDTGGKEETQVTLQEDSGHLHHSHHHCPDCTKSFSQKKLLNRHIRTIHQENNPNTCQVCNNNNLVFIR